MTDEAITSSIKPRLRHFVRTWLYQPLKWIYRHVKSLQQLLAACITGFFTLGGIIWGINRFSHDHPETFRIQLPHNLSFHEDGDELFIGTGSDEEPELFEMHSLDIQRGGSGWKVYYKPTIRRDRLKGLYVTIDYRGGPLPSESPEIFFLIRQEGATKATTTFHKAETSPGIAE